jgi:hypothetical protein
LLQIQGQVNVQGIISFNNPIYFWEFYKPNSTITLNGFRITTTGSVPYAIGQTSEGLNKANSNSPLNLSIFNTYINVISPLPSLVTTIDCGTSTPRLSGSIDISRFKNLVNFTCNNNDITSFSGSYNLKKLTNLNVSNNKISGNFDSLFPDLYSNSELTSFYATRNGVIINSLLTVGGITGTIPDLSNHPKLQNFQILGNSMTGSIPNISPIMSNFACSNNQLSGTIPNLTNATNLGAFFCNSNTNITGTIPSLNTNTLLVNFQVQFCSLSGDIPDLSNNTVLGEFHCNNNSLSGFSGGTTQLPYTLRQFQAYNNQLTTAAVDKILLAFVNAGRAGTVNAVQSILNIGGTGNAAPSYSGGITTTFAGSNFVRVGNQVRAYVTGHGHTTGQIVTITGIGPTTSPAPFQGTFVVTRIDDNEFRYNTISSGSVIGTGTATMRRTTNSSDGYANYQNLALVSRTGGPWNISINQP